MSLKMDVGSEMKQPILSVIIPIYNTHPVMLKECLHSVLNQNLENYEVIAVNDGSSLEHVSETLYEFSQRYNHLSVINKDNNGGAEAINTGIKVARGEYLTIVDHDDIVMAGAFKSLIDAAIKSGSDMATGKIVRFPGNFEFWQDLTPLFNTHATITTALDEPRILKNIHYYNWVFKTSLFLTAVGSIKDRVVADFEIMHRMIAASQGITIIPNAVYMWRRTENSIVSTDEFFIDRLKVMADVALYLQETNKNRAYMRAYLLTALQRLTWYSDKYFNPDNVALTSLYAEILFTLFKVTEIPFHEIETEIMALPISAKNKKIFKSALQPTIEQAIESVRDFVKHDFNKAAKRKSWKKHAIEKIFPVFPMPFAIISRMRNKGYPAALEKAEKKYRSDEDTIMFESFLAKQYTGNPKAIYEYLLKKHPNKQYIWAYNGNPDDIPGNPIIVKRPSPEYYRSMALASKLVNNVIFPTWLFRQKKKYLQTWHGTPLKRIGFDIKVDGPETVGLYNFYHESRNWNGLISANSHSSKKFATAFKHKGDLLEIGYPANDIFYQKDSYQIRRSETRKRLGLSPEEHIILYTPTWRDSHKIGHWQFEFELTPDFDKLIEEGCDSTVLVRQHHLTINRRPTKNARVIDVSAYPDVYDLMVAADVLITDYSAISFDWCCSRKPIVFYTPDIEEYKSQARGFYFSLEESAPGHLCKKESELFDVLRSKVFTSSEIDLRYDSFYQKYCSLHDGTASQKAGDWLIEN
jgi:CDP-glycerol glycerophosphotransferase